MTQPQASSKPEHGGITQELHIMLFIQHGRFFVPVTAAKPSLEAHVEEHLRVLDRDYRQAPEGTSEPIRKAYEPMAEALIEAHRFHCLLPQLEGYWMGHYATETLRLIGLAMEAYQHAQLHLQKPDGDNAFADANHRLDNITRTISDQIKLTAARMFKTFPPVDPGTVLAAMKCRIASIMEVKTAPPYRVGDNYVIEGHILELTNQFADLLELGLRTGETPDEAGTPNEEVYETLGIDRVPKEISSRLTKLKKRLWEGAGQRPFRIDIRMKKGRVVAKIRPKK
jgi:hypothetical protein